MQDVETAIGEDDLLAMGTRILEYHLQLLEADHAALGTLFALHRPTQFGGADRSRTQLADHDAGGQVGQRYRLRQFLASGQTGSQGGNHRIAGTGHIEHFAGARRQVQRAVIRAQQGHAVFATSHQQGAQLQFVHQLGAAADQFGLIGTMTDDHLEFVQVGGDQAGATVDGKILTLGVGQYRNALGPRHLHQGLMVLQRALAVVRQHQHLDPVEQGIDFGRQGLGVGIEGFFEVHAQQLLVATHYAQFDDGRLLVDALKVRLYAGGMQAVSQAVSRFVTPGNADQQRRRAEGGDVQRNVGRAARTILDLFDLDHRYRRLRGNSRCAAVPITVEHDIAHHQNGGLIVTGHGQLHGALRSGKIAANHNM